MHDECVDPDARALAERLTGAADRHALVLGGGTACALRLGHRVSRDLDFFALGVLEPPRLLDELSEPGSVRLSGISAHGLHVTIDGVKLSATSLERPVLAPPDPWHGLPVLSAVDLAELKVVAAVHRGFVRDLCDLHLLCSSGVDLDVAISAASGIDRVVALKALTDPDRFRGQPELELRTPWSIGRAIDFFKLEARRLLA